MEMAEMIDIKNLLLGLVLLVCAAGCSGNSSSGADGGTTDTDTDMDTDTDADSDADSDTDTDTGSYECDPFAEVLQPYTSLCWRRCPLDRTWNGSSCEGSYAQMDWCDASGEDDSQCVPDNPGQNICELTLGSGYRLPTSEEFRGLLGNCMPNDNGDVCNNCASSPTCSGMFGSDDGGYWAEPESLCFFANGFVGPEGDLQSERLVRCLRPQ